MGATLIPGAANASNPGATPLESTNIIGPKEGYTPQVGTLVSMLNWMRREVMWSVEGMSLKDLDYLHDKESNTIGAMLLHLAATEHFYQLNTFENTKWGNWTEKDKQRFEVASELGEQGRKIIKGHTIEFYLDTLKEVRERTLHELKKRDDEWLMKEDTDWVWAPKPTNNYCKWFHVCEHESNHNGQIKYIKSRVPGAKK